MSNLAAFSYDIYTGIWTDWSYGKVMGLTLTLTQQDANLLVAFIAFFVSIAAMHFWKLVCFSIHMYLSSSERRDALHHQRQAVLRNSSDPGATALKLIQMGWIWRVNQNLRYYKRILPLLVITSTLAGVLTIAAGFSSRLARNNYEVLLLGNNCGDPIRANLISQDDLYQKEIPRQAQTLSSASNYALSCYSQNTSSTESCHSMVKPSLTYTVDADAPCPFGLTCLDNNIGIKLDSGIIDSHMDLGINSPLERRFGLRNTWHCAPLATEGYTMVYNISTSRSWTRYQYGAPPQETDGDYLNYTYEASNDAYNDDQVMRPYYNVQKGSAEYILGSISGDRGNDSYRTMYFPSKDLRSSTTDTSLVFLSGNGVKFMEKTPDPWYRATHQIGAMSNTDSSVKTPIYGQGEPASPLACSVSYQYCNYTAAGRTNCAPLHSLWDSQKLAIDYLPFKNDLGAFNWTIARYFEYPADITDVLGAHALLSRRGLNLGMQGPIADNQWQLDVTYWFETALAAFQKIWVYSAAGDHPYLTDDLIQRPNSTGQEQFCRNQKVKNTAYISFGVVGLCLVFGIGLLVIILSAFIETLTGCVQRRTHRSPYSLMEWNTNGTLQLQRLAYEELGMGQWDGCDGEIPYTRRSTELEALDLSNLKHPRIISPDMKIKSCSTTVSVVEDISKGEKISVNASEKSFQISSEEDNISRKFGVTELFTEGDERK